MSNFFKEFSIKEINENQNSIVGGRRDGGDCGDTTVTFVIDDDTFDYWDAGDWIDTGCCER